MLTAGLRRVVSSPENLAILRTEADDGPLGGFVGTAGHDDPRVPDYRRGVAHIG
jgi:hypothetical protein